MGSIYLVRHGQASFGTDDYDRLTETGFTQSRLLGAYFGLRNIRFDAVYTGTMRRHSETLQGIIEGRTQAGEWPPPERAAGLNEYDAEAVVTAFAGALPARDPAAVLREPGTVRDHFRLLKKALLAWTEGATQPVGMPAWQAFQDAAVAAVVAARRCSTDGNVLIVSSGGPIAAITAESLLAPPRTAVELNLRLRNSSVSEFSSSPQRHQLVTFNSLPHLDAHLEKNLTTYA
ncbi:MAG TPA: histidine phosphatase family protein [Steroidobacteraceae bacterium]|nr:histidine phosphatase family protein [Steroidobacteraceae bacterium]